MAGPQHGIISDDFGTGLPESQVDDLQLVDEEKAAKYARSHEYKKLEAHWKATIKKYQAYLPDGRPIEAGSANLEELGRNWLVANQIILELENAMNYYDNAKEVIAKRDGAVQ